MVQPDVRVGMVVGDHIGFVQPGAGVDDGIFQKAGGAHNQGGIGSGYTGFQMPENLPGQGGVAECLDQFRQREVGKFGQAVVIDKVVKNVCAEDQGLRDADIHFRISRSKAGAVRKGLGQKGQASGFTTDGSASDSGKPGRD